MKIKPYWYTNPYMPPKTGCVGRNNHRTQKSTDNDMSNWMETEQESKIKSHQQSKLFTPLRSDNYHDLTTDIPQIYTYFQMSSYPGNKEQHGLIHIGERMPHQYTTIQQIENKQHEPIHTGRPYQCG